MRLGNSLPRPLGRCQRARRRALRRPSERRQMLWCASFLAIWFQTVAQKTSQCLGRLLWGATANRINTKLGETCGKDLEGRQVADAPPEMNDQLVDNGNNELQALMSRVMRESVPESKGGDKM